jgi:hypothetical protein
MQDLLGKQEAFRWRPCMGRLMGMQFVKDEDVEMHLSGVLRRKRRMGKYKERADWSWSESSFRHREI